MQILNSGTSGYKNEQILEGKACGEKTNQTD